MKKANKTFFGLDASEKVKVVRKATDSATKQQLDVVNKHGGIKILKNYSKQHSS